MDSNQEEENEKESEEGEMGRWEVSECLGDQSDDAGRTGSVAHVGRKGRGAIGG